LLSVTKTIASTSSRPIINVHVRCPGAHSNDWPKLYRVKEKLQPPDDLQRYA